MINHYKAKTTESSLYRLISDGLGSELPITWSGENHSVSADTSQHAGVRSRKRNLSWIELLTSLWVFLLKLNGNEMEILERLK